jgi:hypothetical protein
MATKKQSNNNQGSRVPASERRLSVRGVRRDPPDLRKLASALIALAQAQLEAEAAAEHQAKQREANSGHDVPKEAA